jgi:hypothetical protein
MARWTTQLGLVGLVISTPLTARAADCVHADCRPDVIPAEGRTTPPEGFRLQTRHFQGPLIGGVIAAAAGGVIFIGGATGEMSGEPDYSGLFMVTGGASLVTGLGLITYAFHGREEVFVREKIALSVTPVVSTAGAGGTVRLTF